jgi:hypothetical protein
MMALLRIRVPVLFSPWILYPGLVKIKIRIIPKHISRAKKDYSGLKQIRNLFVPESGMEKFGSGKNIPKPQQWIKDFDSH